MTLRLHVHLLLAALISAVALIHHLLWSGWSSRGVRFHVAIAHADCAGVTPLVARAWPHDGAAFGTL